MNETYVEYMVARKSSPFLGVLKVILYVLAVILCLLGLYGSWILLIPGVIFGALAYFVIPQFNDLEYEYLYLDKSITIDKIIGQQKRKRVMELDLNKMEFMAPTNSHEFDSHRNRKIEEKDYSSKDPDSKRFGVLYHDQNGDKIIIIEPNAEMLKAIKTVFPRKLIEY